MVSISETHLDAVAAKRLQTNTKKNKLKKKDVLYVFLPEKKRQHNELEDDVKLKNKHVEDPGRKLRFCFFSTTVTVKVS